MMANRNEQLRSRLASTVCFIDLAKAAFETVYLAEHFHNHLLAVVLDE